MMQLKVIIIDLQPTKPKETVPSQEGASTGNLMALINCSLDSACMELPDAAYAAHNEITTERSFHGSTRTPAKCST